MVVGYDLKIRRVGFSIFAGLRRVTYLGGNYFEQQENVTPSSYPTRIRVNVDPFDKDNLAQAVRRNQFQLLVGSAWNINQRTSLSLIGAAGDQCTFTVPLPRGWWCATGYIFAYAPADFQLSLKYHLKQI